MLSVTKAYELLPSSRQLLPAFFLPTPPPKKKKKQEEKTCPPRPIPIHSPILEAFFTSGQASKQFFYVLAGYVRDKTIGIHFNWK